MQRAPFAVLRQILLDLGFTERGVPGEYTRFDHQQSNLWFVFPAFTAEDAVPVPHLVGVQRLLDERGLLPHDQFEELLRQGSLAG